MAEKDPSNAAEPPKPVHIGGESLLDRLLPHMKQIVVGFIVVAAVGGGIAAVSWFRHRKDIASTEKLDKVLEVAQQPIRGKDDKADPKVPSFGNVKERGAAVLDAIVKQGAEPAVSGAFRAGQLLDAGKIDDAIAEYRKGGAAKGVDGLLCREGLGLALEAKAAGEKDATARQKGLEDALAAFTAMQPDENGPRRAYALYHQARIQELLGKRADAKALFEKAKTTNKDADHEIADLIEKRLAGLGA
jgi:tetratricopeptide (TPR) repeat protein